MPLLDATLPNASYFLVAVTDCEEFDCSVAFFSPECWNVLVLPCREDTPGVHLRPPSVA